MADVAETQPREDGDTDLGSPATSTPGSSSSPVFAFAAWKAELELMLQRESENMHESVQALQSEFDDRSQFVRGDFAWRKQITAFHDRLQDVLTNQLGALAATISSHAALVADSLAQTLAKVERDGQCTVRQQEQKGESALRRARAALAKEVERIARLEKCLRLEEARQAAATLAARERQLQDEHSARESHLQALLGDMRSSNESLETLNTQLLEALMTSRTELDQLRNTLVKCMSRPKRRSSSLSQGEGKSASVEGAKQGDGDKSSKKSLTRGLESLPTTANELLLVPALRQSLIAATQSVAALKNRVSELESARNSDKQRLRDLQLALAQAEHEKAKATRLLSEARAVLINNEGKLAEAAEELVRWKDKLDTVQALAQGQEQALDDSHRLEDARREQLAALTSRLQRVMTIEVRWREFEHTVTKWKERQKDSTQVSDESHEGGRSLEHLVESFLRLEASDGSESPERMGSMETQQELEVRLRYQLQKRFGEQLNLRVSHERRRVLERLERICATEAKDSQERSQRVRQSVPHLSNFESDFTRLKRIVKAAYDQLGLCVGPWAETDLDDLHARLDALKTQVQALEYKLEIAANRAEAQRVALVRAELAQQEKDLLLAEITARYRQMRAAHVAWDSQQPQQEQQQRQPLERKPLTVYGIPQPMAHKPKLQTLLQLPRPSSAAPSLGSVDSLRRLSQPPPSRLGSRLVYSRNSFDLQRKRRDERVEEVEEHVRSVLKSALMRSETENQLEDTVGSDGVSCSAQCLLHFRITSNSLELLLPSLQVLEILHRRRHRK